MVAYSDWNQQLVQVCQQVAGTYEELANFLQASRTPRQPHVTRRTACSL